MMDIFIEMISYPFMVRAIIVGCLVSLCASLLGTSLVLKRYSMIGDGLSHVGFAALAIAYAFHAEPLTISIPACIAAAFFLLQLKDSAKIKGDSATALLCSGALAIGVMTISLSTGMNTDVCNYMFGSILAMSADDVRLSVILGIAVAGGSFKSLALMAGALSFGAGLGLQNVVSNLVAGITILFERPIKLGDLVVINGYEGVVKQISMSSTTLETGNKSNVIIPNSAIIAGSVVNKTYDNRMARVDINVGVDYDSDIDKVKKILLRIAGEDEEVLSNPAPALSFLDFGDSSLNFQLNCYTANIANSSGISFRIREKIINEFRKEGINIPFPQRVVRSLEESAAD